MEEKKPDPIICPALRDPNDEYTPGEFAGVEEPEINLERIRRYWRDADERMKKESPEKFGRLEEMRKRSLNQKGGSGFNRRRSHSRGKLFYRLLLQAVALEPAPYKALVGGVLGKSQHPNM